MGTKMKTNKKFINKEVVKTKEEPRIESNTNSSETKNGVVSNAFYVKIRSKPSYKAEVLGVLRQGDKVTILGEFGDFYKVLIGTNKIAYISSEFIKEE